RGTRERQAARRDREVHPRHHRYLAAPPKEEETMNSKRRKLLQALGGTGIIAAAQPWTSAPAFAQNAPLRIGILAPRAGIAGTIGECGLKGTQFAVDHINSTGGIAGRRVELLIEEETNP